MIRIWSVAVVLMLAACGYYPERPQKVAESPPSVSYTVTNDNIGEANGRAADYCAQFNLRPVAGPITQSGTENVATYTCR